MTATVWTVLGLGLLAFVVCRAGRVWVDAGRLADRLGLRLRWTVLGTLFPDRYWWGARVAALPDEDRDDLLERETAALELSRADAERCPLCCAEIPHAWTMATHGPTDPASATVAEGPVQCPSCDFRLDACRHCAHFSPGGPPDWGRWTWDRGDESSGRCTHYHSVQPVEVACATAMARHLKRKGYDQIRAPLPIMDSYLPPDFCRAFRPDQRRLRVSGIRWPDARRATLLRLESASLGRSAGRVDRSLPDEKLPEADEAWLL